MTKRRNTRSEIAEIITQYRDEIINGHPRGSAPAAEVIADRLGLTVNTVYYHINRMRISGQLYMQDGNYPTAVIVEALARDGDK